jgi:hypothetical protein
MPGAGRPPLKGYVVILALMFTAFLVVTVLHLFGVLR